MIPPETFEPLQLKGEVMDMEFTVDTDHRYAPLNPHLSHLTCRLINRAPLYSRYWPKIGREGGIGPLKAASTVILQKERCVAPSYTAPPLLLNSLHKCDRKRPCQRCIQLGLVIS